MTDFSRLATISLAGDRLSRDDAFAVLQTEDRDLSALLNGAFQVREKFFGRKVKICVLQNARSGLCPEDCRYCSQSSISRAPIDKYKLLSTQELFDGARRAAEAGARRYCMVTSGRGPDRPRHRPLDACYAADQGRVSRDGNLRVAGLGERAAGPPPEGSRRRLGQPQSEQQPPLYPEICTTHTYDDRVETVRNVKQAGLSTCSGGIVGMGETDDDVIELAYAVRALGIDSVPVNFLYPIDGTPLGPRKDFNPVRGLKALCLMRFLNPGSEDPHGRRPRVVLGQVVRLAFYPANSISSKAT